MVTRASIKIGHKRNQLTRAETKHAPINDFINGKLRRNHGWLFKQGGGLYAMHRQCAQVLIVPKAATQISDVSALYGCERVNTVFNRLRLISFEIFDIQLTISQQVFVNDLLNGWFYRRWQQWLRRRHGAYLVQPRASMVTLRVVIKVLFGRIK